MLQEEQTVSFQPLYDTFVPWYIRLFHFFLALMILLALIRSARILWSLRTQRISAKQSDCFSHLRSQDFWEHLYVRTRSLKSLSHLTVLVSLLSLLWSLAGDLTQVATQKTAGMGALAGGLADTLRTFSSGIVISVFLFCVAVLCERLIRIRKLGVALKQSEKDSIATGG